MPPNDSPATMPKDLQPKGEAKPAGGVPKTGMPIEALAGKALKKPAVPDDAEFMRDVDAATLQAPSPVLHGILWATLAFVIAAIVWASMSYVGETTVGEGKVIPSSQVQVVQNLEGGIISEIKVGVGDMVRKNQVLMLIDDTRYTSSFQENKGKNDALAARVARLTAEVSGSSFSMPEQFRRQNPDLVEREFNLYRSRQAEFTANTAAIKQQIDQRTQELREKRTRLGQIQTSLDLVNKELTLSAPLVKHGALSEVELLRLERQSNDLKGELESTKINIPRLELAVGEMTNKLEGYRAKFRADAQAELNQVRAEQESLAATGVALKDRVERAVVRSPMNGTVKSLKINTVGGVVQPGSELLEIVPAEDNLLVEAKIKPRDIAFLRPGQEASVKITAYDFSIYGGFPAKVENISADTVLNEKTQESFYLVRVRTTSTIPAHGGKDPLAIMPGMTATVHIKTGEKNLMQYMLKPIIKTKELAFRER
jgi:membrane fusion protein, adhesin transport system